MAVCGYDKMDLIPCVLIISVAYGHNEMPKS
jgi:hypothetical protein